MQWALIVYFFVAGEWYSAEQLDMDGWFRKHYPDAETCIVRQNAFAETMHLHQHKIRAQCELDGDYN